MKLKTDPKIKKCGIERGLNWLTTEATAASNQELIKIRVISSCWDVVQLAAVPYIKSPSYKVGNVSNIDLGRQFSEF